MVVLSLSLVVFVFSVGDADATNMRATRRATGPTGPTEDRLTLTLFSFPGFKSHGFVACALANEMGSRGFEVGVLVWKEDKSVQSRCSNENVTVVEFELNITSYISPYPALRKFIPEDPKMPWTADLVKKVVARISQMGFVWNIMPATGMMAATCDAILASDNAMAWLKSSKLLVADVAVACWQLLSAKTDLPVAVYTGVGTFEPVVFDFGPNPASVVPSLGLGLTDKMSTFSIALNYVGAVLLRWLVYPVTTYVFINVANKHNITLDGQKLSNAVDYDNLCRKVVNRAGVVLVLSDTAFDFPRPVNSNVWFVGHPLSKVSRFENSNLSLINEHDKAILSWVQNASRGTVLFSLGTACHLQAGNAQLIADALQRLPGGIRVLWKLNAEPTYKPDNTMFCDWMEQNDLLAHPKVRVFVTHGGRNSLEEAAFHGVPVVVLPFGADQYDNSLRAVDKGFGRMLDAHRFTAEELVEAIVWALGDEPAKNAELVKARIRAHPRSATKRAGDVLQYAAKLIEISNGSANGMSFMWPERSRHQRGPLSRISATLLMPLLCLLAGWHRCCCYPRRNDRAAGANAQHISFEVVIPAILLLSVVIQTL